jgi:hypothetical protein
VTFNQVEQLIEINLVVEMQDVSSQIPHGCAISQNIQLIFNKEDGICRSLRMLATILW